MADARAPWPDPSEWPTDDASAVDWAVFYRDCLGLDVYPTPSARDVVSLARHDYDKAVAAWREDNGGAAPDEEAQALLWDEAREYAEGSTRGPCGWAVWRRNRVEFSDADFRACWTNDPSARPGSPAACAAERGICVSLGRSSRGWWLAQVDVDAKHGADLAGEFASLPGPADRSPSGGLHVYVLNPGVGEGRVYASANALAPGVEVRTSGYAMLPSGAGGDPARRWLRWEEPRPPPESLTRPPPRPSRVGVRGGGAAGGGAESPSGPRGTGAPTGRAAAALADPVEQDDRNATVVVVVGMLARPGALPEDVVEAALGCLVEARAALDGGEAETRAEAARWRAALIRGPRDEAFAAEVVEAWLLVRYVGRRPWGRGEVVRTVRSLWRTAARRQAERGEGDAGAEDRSVGDPVWCEDRDAAHARLLSPPPPPPPPPTPAPPGASETSARGPSQIGDDAAFEGAGGEHASRGRSDGTGPMLAAAYPFAPPTAPAVVRGGGGGGNGDEPVVDYSRLFRSFYDAYPEAKELADEQARPVSFAVGPPLYDFYGRGANDGRGDERYPFGYGLGPWLARALPGLRPGQMTAWGAASAKGGKTFTVGFLLEGLVLATARRLLGEPAYASAPHVLVFWLTEMPEEGELQRRFQARHFGFPLAAVSEGVAAVDLVEGFGLGERAMSPAEVVSRARLLRSIHRREQIGRASWHKDGNDPHWSEIAHHAAHRIATRELLREIDFTVLPDPDGRGAARRVHDAGPRLVDHVARAMLRRLDEYCASPIHGAAGPVDPDDVLLVAAWDPGQRFTDEGASGKQSLDALLNALRKRLCSPRRVGPDGVRRGGAHACVVITSDTTKAAAKDTSVARFCHDPPATLAAEVFAGSQLIPHVANTVAIFAEPNPDRRTALLRIRPLQVRSMAPAEGVYPFTWDLATGRLRALDPATVPLPAKPPPRDAWGRPQGAAAGPPVGAPGDGGRPSAGSGASGGVWRRGSVGWGRRGGPGDRD